MIRRLAVAATISLVPAALSTAPAGAPVAAQAPHVHLDMEESPPVFTPGVTSAAFREPVRAGDVLEISCELTRVGRRSRELAFAVHVVARGAATEERPGAARMLAEPLVATTAVGTVVVPG